MSWIRKTAYQYFPICFREQWKKELFGEAEKPGGGGGGAESEEREEERGEEEAGEAVEDDKLKQASSKFIFLLLQFFLHISSVVNPDPWILIGFGRLDPNPGGQKNTEKEKCEEIYC